MSALLVGLSLAVLAAAFVGLVAGAGALAILGVRVFAAAHEGQSWVWQHWHRARQH